MKPDDITVIPFHKASLRLVACFFLGMEGLGAWMIAVSLQGSGIDVGKLAFGLVFFLVGALCGLITLQKLLDIRPAMILSPDGLWDNSSTGRPLLIPWTEIDHFFIGNPDEAPTLAIRFKDAQWPLRTGRRVPNIPYGKTRVLSHSGPQSDLKELRALCERYHRKYGVEAVPAG